MAAFNLFRRRRVNMRTYQRLPATWPIKCEPQTKEDGRHLTSIGDVSAGGVSVTVPEIIPAGTKIHLEICVTPIGKSIHAVGQVVRCSPTPGNRFALGIRYIAIDPQDRITLNEAIEAHYRPHRHRKPWWRIF